MIYGPNKKLVDAACFFAEKLGIAHLDFDLEIKLKKQDEDKDGVCRYFKIDDEHLFEIEIEKRKKKRHENKYEILAHEMVHVKQYLTGQLVDHGDEAAWTENGETRMIKDGNNDGSEDAYWDSPWEIEAFGRQRGLYVRWINSKEE